MKSNGLSSTARNKIRKLNRHSVQISFQERILAVKEQQKTMRLLAEKAEAARKAAEPVAVVAEAERD